MKPNPIDFNKVLVEFTKLGETGKLAVIVTVAVVLMTYIVVLVIVRRMDRRDDAREVSLQRFQCFSPPTYFGSNFPKFVVKL